VNYYCLLVCYEYNRRILWQQFEFIVNITIKIKCTYNDVIDIIVSKKKKYWILFEIVYLYTRISDVTNSDFWGRIEPEPNVLKL